MSVECLFKDRLPLKMSRLLRATVRRDKSYALMNTLEEDNQERQVLNILECMKLILHDIDPKKIPTTLHKKKNTR